MDRSDNDNLFAELRELRPQPRPEFTAELDERAAAGFPRRADPSKTVTPFTLLAEHWRAMSPRRRLMPVLGFALAAVVVATVVIASTGGRGGDSDLMTSAMSGEAASAPNRALRQPLTTESSGGAEIESESAEVEESSGGAASAEAIEEPPAEGAEHFGEKAGKSSAGGAAAVGAGGTVNGPEKSTAEKSTGITTGHRDIERSAYIILGTKPGEIGGAAGKVYEAVHAAHGIVLHSSVDSGKNGATGAVFELLIPTGKVDDALASISQIAEVRTRHDATTDITAPTVDAAEELADSNASIEGLLKELGNVETEAEHESVEARLREARRQHAAIRASLDHLRERGAMSEVTVRIVTSHGAGATPPAAEESDGSWGVGDALHDAGHILTIAAGIVLIGLAFLAPIALIALLFWLGNRFRVRRLRERTLG
jgi:hypothetical protein